MIQLRKGIDCVGLTVVYFCHDGKGNFVLARRSQNARDEKGKWDIGGGALEFGDSVEMTLRKEIKEEYMVDVLDYEFLGYRDVHRENAGTKTHWVALDFKVRVSREDVKNGEPNKFDEIRWFALDEFPSDNELHSQLPIALKMYKSKL